MCLCFFSFSFVSFNWLFFVSGGLLYQFYDFSSLFQFVLAVLCSNINERICNAYSLYAFVLFDESKGGEKLENGKLIKLKA